MKKILVPSLLLFLLPLLSLSQDKPDLTAAATAFVNQLAKGDYEAAAKPFTDKMREAAPPGKLGEIWKAIQTQMGAFQRITGTRVEPVGGFQSVFVTSEFAGATVDLQVTFDSAGRLAGFFVRPTEAGKTEAPQEWTAPAYADQAHFREEEVTVGSGEWALPGTLTLPMGEGPSPAVVLVHGSGPHDRDETIGPNKPFKDLAWGLASRGIAVLRYEKRTKVYGLKLLALPGLTAKEEIVDDVVAAANLLRGRKEVDPQRIFVLGHSLGGTLIPRTAKADPGIAGFIVMAGAARPLEDLLLEQVPYIASVDGTVTEAEKGQIEDVKAMVETIRGLKEGSKDAPMGVPASYWLDLRGYHPPAVARELKQPFLILQGERDYQVTMEDYELWRKALADRKDVTFKAYPDLNHLFMEGRGKATPEEYGRPGHVAAGVVEEVAGWIKSPVPAQVPPPAGPPYANKAAFREQEVTVGLGEWALPGTLTLPVGEGSFPGVVLVHGSGPHDRDETIGPNKPFRDLAWGLASRGIAVLRYEKRTRAHGAKLVAAFPELTVKEETVDDALAAVALLRGRKEIDARRIFILGHSLGGMLAPRMAKADPGIAGLIVMAGPGRPLEDVIVEQNHWFLNLDGEVTDQEKAGLGEVAKLAAQVKALDPATASPTDFLLGLPVSYWLGLRGYLPAEAARDVKQPLLILHAEKDFQVTANDLEAWRRALAGREDATIKTYPGLSHLFMKAVKGTMEDYYGFSDHVAEAVIVDVADWIAGFTARSDATSSWRGGCGWWGRAG